ncbi:MAG: cell division protein FtsX, partial [Pseudomonadota bacterium]
MRAGAAPIWARLRDSSADKIVPATGATAQLTVFVAGAMAFMCVFALAVALAANTLAARWGDALSGVATIEVGSGDSADLQRTLALLAETPGVRDIREVDEDRQRALLAPWFGPDFPVETLALPRLIELRESGELDRQALVERLRNDVPSARYLAPDAWEARVAAAARTIGLAAWGLILLTGAVMAASPIVRAAAATRASQ